MIDDAYCHLWSEYSRQKIDELTFLRLNREGLKCIMDEAHLNSVLMATGSWESVGSELNSLLEASMLGQKLFRRACEAMASERICKAVVVWYGVGF